MIVIMPLLQMRANNGSPWSTASESPTPTNSVAEQRAQGLLLPHGNWPSHGTGWANQPNWPLVAFGEEHTQLLGDDRYNIYNVMLRI